MIISLTGENIIVGSKAVLITENVSLHLNATSLMPAPNHHIWGKTILWQFFVLHRVDVLLHILSGEVVVVVRLPQVLGARLAGKTFRHIETTGITCIPVCEAFHEVRVGGGLLRLGRWRIISSASGRR